MHKQELIERARVLEVARTWIGTPFHDLARTKGAGVDCAQLIIAVFGEAGLIDSFDPGYYSPQFFLHRGDETFLSFVLKHARPIRHEQAKPADVVVWKIGRVFAHGAILAEEGWPGIIHAFKKAGVVMHDQGDQGDLLERERRFFRYNGWGEGR